MWLIFKIKISYAYVLKLFLYSDTLHEIHSLFGFYVGFAAWMIICCTDLPLQFEWPEVEKGSGMRETKMIYKFDYLPAGLFNRGQVSAALFPCCQDQSVCVEDTDDDFEWLWQLDLNGIVSLTFDLNQRCIETLPHSIVIPSSVQTIVYG